MTSPEVRKKEVEKFFDKYLVDICPQWRLRGVWLTMATIVIPEAQEADRAKDSKLEQPIRFGIYRRLSKKCRFAAGLMAATVNLIHEELNPGDPGDCEYGALSVSGEDSEPGEERQDETETIDFCLSLVQGASEQLDHLIQRYTSAEAALDRLAMIGSLLHMAASRIDLMLVDEPLDAVLPADAD